MPKTVQGLCRLCGNERDLQRSHIVPKFVTRWIIKTSPTGGLRMVRDINRRLQDGETRNLLCSECEQVFSKEESAFARHIFLPFHENKATQFDYDEWALRFGVSVVWRALVYQGEEPLSHLSPAQLEKTRKAERVWREFLLGTRPNPGRYSLHLIPLMPIGPNDAQVMKHLMNVPLSPHINRHILRSAMNDVVRREGDIIVYVKLCRLLFVGIVEAESLTPWRSTLVNLKHGHTRASVTPMFPTWVLNYMNSKADQAHNSFAQMNEADRTALNERFLANADAVAQSEVFRAAQMDFELFGTAALGYGAEAESGA